MGQVRRGGYTLVPMRIYFNGREIAKCELVLPRARNRMTNDRHRDRDWQRQKSRLMRNSDL